VTSAQQPYPYTAHITLVLSNSTYADPAAWLITPVLMTATTQGGDGEGWGMRRALGARDEGGGGGTGEEGAAVGSGFLFAAAEDGEWARHAHIERICSAWRPPSLVTVIACEVS
jgi:hypothetical protein